MSTNSTPAAKLSPIVFANAFGLRVGDNDCTLRFLMSEEPTDLAAAELQSSVVMTPRSLKALAGILIDAILELENALGAELPARDERYLKMFRAAKEGWTSNPASVSTSSES